MFQAGSHLLNFNPRLPCGRRHFFASVLAYENLISIPASHAGGDCLDLAHVLGKPRFQSPPPMREATAWSAAIAATGQFQSPPPMREATHNKLPLQVCRVISIPASHAGGDLREIQSDCRYERISIPASHAGGDGGWQRGRSCAVYFNPRLPCGRRLQHIVLLTISLPDIVKSHSRKQKRAS